MPEDGRTFATLISPDGKQFAIGFKNPEVDDAGFIYMKFTDCCLYTLMFDIVEYLKAKHPCKEPK